MYNILNSISFVNLYTELATVIRLAVVFFFKSGIQMCTTAIIIMGTWVGQVAASAHHGNMDTPANQSPGRHIWQVSAAPWPHPLGLQHRGSWDSLGLFTKTTKRRIL